MHGCPAGHGDEDLVPYKALINLYLHMPVEFKLLNNGLVPVILAFTNFFCMTYNWRRLGGFNTYPDIQGSYSSLSHSVSIRPV